MSTPPTELRHKVAAARLWAAHRFPYLASVLFASPVVYREGTGTVSADRHWRLYVDAERAATWPVETLGSLFVLQANHLLREHAERAEALGLATEDAQAWADAADAEINDDLVGQLSLPDDDKVVMPDDFDAPRGRLAEEYFELVKAAAKAADDGGDDGDGEGDFDSSQGGGDEGEQAPADGDARPDRGSGTDGQSRPDELGDQPTDGSPSSADAPIPDSTAELIRRQAAADIANEARQHGNVPAGLLRWAQARLHPKVDWRRQLAAELRRCVADVRGQVDYSYRRPSRRAGATPDVVLPALRRPQPEVVVVCDTSGSMGEERLEQVLAEVEGLLQSIGVGGLTVLAVDAEVHSARRVQHAAQVELLGGGGTDMGAGIAAAIARRPRPDIVVVLTDGETPWPAAAPRGVRVVVGLLGARAPQGPRWARSVRIDDAA
ncbi:MAG: hypothetical protein IT196_23860 [Acidimicrobiales bacterium]|nr:hypothetical protein [Acidimicrobiales bacterium]